MYDNDSDDDDDDGDCDDDGNDDNDGKDNANHLVLPGLSSKFQWMNNHLGFHHFDYHEYELESCENYHDYNDEYRQC